VIAQLQRFQFIAKEMDHGWAFKSMQSGRFLGVPQSTARMKDGTELTLVEKPFSWLVLPVQNDPLKFK
jgi:hypothetical protein